MGGCSGCTGSREKARTQFRLKVWGMFPRRCQSPVLNHRMEGQWVGCHPNEGALHYGGRKLYVLVNEEKQQPAHPGPATLCQGTWLFIFKIVFLCLYRTSTGTACPGRFSKGFPEVRTGGWSLTISSGSAAGTTIEDADGPRALSAVTRSRGQS